MPSAEKERAQATSLKMDFFHFFCPIPPFTHSIHLCNAFYRFTIEMFEKRDEIDFKLHSTLIVQLLLIFLCSTLHSSSQWRRLSSSTRRQRQQQRLCNVRILTHMRCWCVAETEHFPCSKIQQFILFPALLSEYRCPSQRGIICLIHPSYPHGSNGKVVQYFTKSRVVESRKSMLKREEMKKSLMWASHWRWDRFSVCFMLVNNSEQQSPWIKKPSKMRRAKKGEKTLKTSMKDRAKTLKILQEETPFSSVHTHQENDEVPRMEFNVESFSQFFRYKKVKLSPSFLLQCCVFIMLI